MALIERIRLERIWLIAYNDFRVRYYESYLGVLWSLINPLLKSLAYYYIFSNIFNVKIPNFGIYIYVGTIIWSFFQETTKKSMRIYMSKIYLLDNINMPKLDIHIASNFSVLLGFLVNVFMYFILAFFAHIPFSVSILYVIPLLCVLFMYSMSIGIILSLVFPRLPDFEHIWDFVMMIGMWFTPVFYVKEMFMKNLSFLMYLFPIEGLIIQIREAIMYQQSPDMFFFWYDLVFALLLYIVSLSFLKQYSGLTVEKL